jgi:hypothetical protein
MDDTIYLHDYKNYWIEDTAHGHLIKICYGADDRILEIDCRWVKRKRDKSERVVNDILVETSKVLRRTKKKLKEQQADENNQDSEHNEDMDEKKEPEDPQSQE